MYNTATKVDFYHPVRLSYLICPLPRVTSSTFDTVSQKCSSTAQASVSSNISDLKTISREKIFHHSHKQSQGTYFATKMYWWYACSFSFSTRRSRSTLKLGKSAYKSGMYNNALCLQNAHILSWPHFPNLNSS